MASIPIKVELCCPICGKDLKKWVVVRTAVANRRWGHYKSEPLYLIAFDKKEEKRFNEIEFRYIKAHLDKKECFEYISKECLDKYGLTAPSSAIG